MPTIHMPLPELCPPSMPAVKLVEPMHVEVPQDSEEFLGAAPCEEPEKVLELFSPELSDAAACAESLQGVSVSSGVLTTPMVQHELSMRSRRSFTRSAQLGML